MYDLNMNEIEFPEGFIPLDIFISSIDKDRITDKVEGGNRKLNYGSTYNERDIQLSILLKAHDTQDYRLLRDATYALFNKCDSFYLAEKYQRGKRYLVSVDEKYIPDRMTRRHATATINCITIGLPFAESIGTTQDIHNNGINADDGLWGFGMGLEAVDESLSYTHNATVNKPFFIYNAGDVSIHPFEQKFKMTISNVRGSTERFQITNLTNGSRARINVPLRSTDVVVYDGPNVTRNKLTFLRDTRKDFIELSPGWNNFRIYYCDSATISFDFPFYYL